MKRTEPVIDVLVVIATYRSDRRRGMSHRESLKWALWTWRNLPLHKSDVAS